MAKKKQPRAARAVMGAWESTDVYNGNVPSLDRPFHQMDIGAALLRAEEFAKDNLFVRVIAKLRMGFFNHGLQIKGLADKRQKAEARAFVRDVWRCWLKQDNVISFWRLVDGQPGPLINLDLGQCVYADPMGFESLRIRLNLTAKQLEGIPEPLRTRLKKQELVLPDLAWEREHPDWREFFMTLRRGSRGRGLASPEVQAAFPELEQFKDMRVGDNLLGKQSKDVIRLHRKGHEIKQGPKAGTATHFLKDAFASSLEKALKKKKGAFDLVQNFDYEVVWRYLDPKSFDGAKWKGVLERLMWWSGPLGFMLAARSLTPHLMPMLKAEAHADREEVQEHVEAVLSARYDCDVSVKWSDKCFSDLRLAFDIMKTLLASGPLDTSSALEHGGYDVDEVRERKRGDIELMKKEPGMVRPAFDAAHGDKNARGRPQGTEDRNNSRQEQG